MTRALLLAALFAPFAAAQAPPTAATPPAAAPALPKAEVTKAKPVAEKPKPTLDQIIAAAMHANPDVKIAEAEVQLAQAKLNAVKVAAALKVTGLKDAMDECERKIAQEKESVDRCEALRAEYHNGLAFQKEMAKSGQSTPFEVTTRKGDLAKAESNLSAAKASLESLQATLARHQQEWKRLSEAAEKSAAINFPANGYFTLTDPTNNMNSYSTLSTLYPSTMLQNDLPSTLYTIIRPTYTYGNITTLNATAAAKAEPESLQGKLRLALDKPIAFESLNSLVLDDVLEVLFKKADLNVQVHRSLSLGLAANYAFRVETRPGTMTLPLGSWLQLVTDCISDDIIPEGIDAKGLKDIRVEFYVRDYGLQLARKNTAAPGAIPLSEFWKSPKPDAVPKK